MSEDNDETVEYRNMKARRERIWVYSVEDAYEYKIAWRLKKLDLEHEHLFDFEKDGYSFQYFMFSHGRLVYRVPVPVVQALKGE